MSFFHFTLLGAFLITVANTQSGGVSKHELCQAVKKCSQNLDHEKNCRILPVLKSSLLTPVPEGTFDLKLLRPGVWVYSDGIYRTLILRAGHQVAVIDIPDSPQSNKPNGSMTIVTDAVEKILEGAIPTRINIIYSHAHFDHIGGTVKFFNYMKILYPSVDILIWGTKESFDLVKNSITNRALLPNVIIGEKGRILYMSETLKVRMQIVGGHTAEDLLIYIPKSNTYRSVLMYVDTVFPGWAPPIRFGLSEDLGSYIRVQKAILKLDFDIFVAGHFGLGTKKDVLKNVRYTEDVIRAAGVSERISMPDADRNARFSNPEAREFGNIWYLFFRVVRPSQIDTCYRIVLEKWGCRLSGVDVNLRSHCLTALLYRTIDL